VNSACAVGLQATGKFTAPSYGNLAGDGKSYDQIWNAAHKVADEHLQIHEQDKTRGVVSRP
jgi:hypothetical protein